MKKSSLLTFITGAAIVATTAGTFAAWDNLTATKTGVSLDTADSHTITIQSENLAFNNKLGPDNPTSTADFKITAKNLSKIALSAKNVQLGGATVDETKVKVTFYESDGTTIVPTEGDSGITANGDNEYKVKVELLDVANEANASKQITFDIEANGTKDLD